MHTDHTKISINFIAFFFPINVLKVCDCDRHSSVKNGVKISIIFLIPVKGSLPVGYIEFGHACSRAMEEC